MKVALVIVTAVLMPGGLLVLAAMWLRRRQVERERRAIELYIVPPREIFGKTTPREMDALRAAAERRREHADERRRDAHLIESGQPIEERLRLIK